MASALLAMVYRHAVERVRYWFDSVAAVASAFMIFLLVFLSSRLVSPLQLGHDLTAAVVSFFAWTVVTSQWQAVGWALADWARAGTLEHLFLCRYGLGTLAFGQMLATLLDLLPDTALLALMLAVTGQRLHIDALPVAVLLVLLAAQGGAFGLALGGLALRFKRVEAAFSLVNLVVAALVAVPVHRWPPLAYAPMSLAADLLRRVMARGAGLPELLPDLALCGLLTLLYAVLGYLVLATAERTVRATGTLGLH